MAFTPEQEQKLQKFLDMLDESSRNRSQNTLIKSLQDQAEQVLKVNKNFSSMGPVLSGLGSTVTKVTSDLVKGVGKAAEELTRNIMSDAIGFRTAGSYMKSMIGLFVGTVTSVSDMLGKIGTTVGTSMNKGLAVAGLALQGLGKAASAAASVLGQMAGVVIDIVVQSMEGLTRTFFDVSRAGGVFGGGMNDLAALARQAGLSIAATGKLITENSEALARSGISVTGASRIAISTLASGGNQLKSSLFGLGFALEDHAGVVAQAMANMTAAGDPFRANTPETVQATTELAKNMRLMANYTGEDLKRKQEEANQYKRYLTLQRVLLNMEPTQRQNFMQKFSLLTEQERKNALDVMEFGQIINRTGAAMAGSNAEYASYQRGLVDNLMNTNVGLEQFERDRAQVLPGLIRGIAEDRSLAAAQVAGVGGIAGDMVKGLGDIGYLLGNRTVQGLETAASDVGQAGKGVTGLTAVVFDASKAMMKFKSDLEQIAIGLAPKFNEMFASMTQLIQAITPLAVGAFNLMTETIKKSLPVLEAGMKGVSQVESDTVRDTAGYGGTALGALGGALTGKGLGMLVAKGLSLIPHPAAKILGGLMELGLTAGGAVIGGVQGKETSEGLFDMLKGMWGGGKAIGGPVVPNKAYLVGEQGPEMFRPGSSDDIISNNQLRSMSSKTDMLLAELKQIMQEQAALTKQIIETHQDGTEVMRDMRNINQQMLNNQY